MGMMANHDVDVLMMRIAMARMNILLVFSAWSAQILRTIDTKPWHSLLTC